jgi:hypothetical protein
MLSIKEKQLMLLRKIPLLKRSQLLILTKEE